LQDISPIVSILCVSSKVRAPSRAAAPAASISTVASPVAPISAEAAERRLQTLQRLRDKGLISEQEFQAKRQQVLDGL